MSSISSISSYSLSGSYTSTRPSASELASDLFSQLDTSGKGYIEESDLASALSSLSGSSSTSSASDIFTQLDTDGDGKVTESEMTSSLTKLADELNSQFDQSRMQDASGSTPPPPPPPPENDTGFTQSELEQQLSEIGTSDSERASLISSVISNFSSVDTDSDGKVTFDEAMSYSQSSSATSSSSSTSSSTSSDSDSSSSSSDTSTQTTDAQMFRQLMDLLRLYGDSSQSGTSSTLSSLVSTVA